jgi:hypothetical protein
LTSPRGQIDAAVHAQKKWVFCCDCLEVQNEMSLFSSDRLNARRCFFDVIYEFELRMSQLEVATEMPQVDPSIEKFPYCIVWTPIPCITWLLPFIGEVN